MKKAVRFISFVMVLLVILASFTSCSTSLGQVKSATVAIDDKNVLKLPVCNTDSLNPYEATTEYNLALSTLLFEGLVKISEDFKPVNVLAKSVNVKDKTVTVEVNTACCFSDASYVTAGDVEYSYNLAKNSDNFKKQLENFKEISVAGNTITFTLKNSDRFAALCLDFPIIKKQDTDYKGFLIGSGKYKMENNETLVMNERWNNSSLPCVRRIRLVNMLDTVSGPESVETGNISFYFQDMANGNYIRKNVKTHESLMTNIVFLGMNSQNEHLAKNEVRQAISLLVPRDTIAEKSYLGYAKTATSPFIPTWHEIVGIKTDNSNEALNEAKELLESAGYSKGDDPMASVMRLRLLVNGDNPFKVSAAENIANALGSMGITVVIEKVTFEYLMQRLERGEYELYIGETKLSKNMNLSPFFSSQGGASYGIDTGSKIISTYEDFLSGKVTTQRFVDYFNVAVPFAPICFRCGIEMYTNELFVTEYGTPTDRFENIYSWYY